MGFLTMMALSVYVNGLRSSNLIRCWAVLSVNSPGTGSDVPLSTDTNSTPAFWDSPVKRYKLHKLPINLYISVWKKSKIFFFTKLQLNSNQKVCKSNSKIKSQTNQTNGNKQFIFQYIKHHYFNSMWHHWSEKYSIWHHLSEKYSTHMPNL